jgi:hypothetical protein
VAHSRRGVTLRGQATRPACGGGAIAGGNEPAAAGEHGHQSAAYGAFDGAAYLLRTGAHRPVVTASISTPPNAGT